MTIDYYNADATDLFLFALGNVFDINIVIFRLNERECWAEDLMMAAIEKLSILFQNIDPIVPILTQHTSLDDSVEITNVL